jgi:hypothetical protein
MTAFSLPSALELVDDGVSTFLLWDFDGVLNPFHITGTYPKAFYNPRKRFRAANPHYDPKRSWGRNKEPKSYPVIYSEELMQDVSELHSDPTVQPLLVTTWRSSAIALLEEMGVASERSLFALPWGDDDQDYKQFKKVAAVRNYFAPLVGHPQVASLKLVWVDDEVLNPEAYRVLSPLEGTPFDDSNSLLVCPEGKWGLSRADMAQMRAFVS